MSEHAFTTTATTATYAVLLRHEDAADLWAFLDKYEAPSAEAAIRAYCKKHGDLAGTYVAVPSRSWKPVTVKAETTTVLRLEDA